MCGIFGAFLRRPLKAGDIARCRSAIPALSHRGPDGSGEWHSVDDGVFLGHRRLAILDLSEDNAQPMAWRNHRLVYNGEIYNFADLKNSLIAKGHRFSTAGDTEVLLKSLAENPDTALDQLDGMFAFGLWDGNCGWLAVDPFGEKPLYYAETADGIWFSSELNPLVEALDPEIRTDPEFMTAFISLGYVPAPKTAYKNIHAVQPGTLLKIKNGLIDRRRHYWHPPPPPPQHWKGREPASHGR